MKLMHMTGSIVKVDVARCGDEMLLCMDGGDVFGPLIAGMMFTSFPECIVSASDEEKQYLRIGGFILDV